MQNYLPQKTSEDSLHLEIDIEGSELLHNPLLNKGTAFTKEERQTFGLEGLLPPHISTLSEQVVRLYENFQRKHTNLEKYVYLRSLQDRNETLFYALVHCHLEEMLPIIYTPTVGEAVQMHSHIYRFARGLYVSPENVDRFPDMIRQLPSREIEMIVVTDNQGILGIGDQGIGGMGIPIGKLSLYTLGAGIHPSACLPISLDVGTDNEKLLSDPLYLGSRRRRYNGNDYFHFIETFVKQIQSLFPKAVLQWEDFSKQNAFQILDQYRETCLTFNDDIQGTGSVAVAGILNATRMKREKFADQIFCIYGAGAGGLGVTRQIYNTLLEEGLSSEEAKRHIFVLDRKGLITTEQKKMEEYKKFFARSDRKPAALLEVIHSEKVTVLLGLSGAAGSFSRPVVEAMLKNSNRPIIFPLSNPNANAEATPQDVIDWSRGRALVATGSPFLPVHYNGKEIPIGQGNNAFIFPGVGLGILASRARKISDAVFNVAARRLAATVPESEIDSGKLYPPIRELRRVSLLVAEAVFDQVLREGGDFELSCLPREILQERMWKPVYVPYSKSISFS